MTRDTLVFGIRVSRGRAIGCGVASAIKRRAVGTGVDGAPVMPGVCPKAAPRPVVIPVSQIAPLAMYVEVVKIGVCDQVRKVIFCFCFLVLASTRQPRTSIGPHQSRNTL